MEEARRIIEEILTNREIYFDKNLVLNSEGRKLLEKAIEILMKNNFKHVKTLREARKNPSIENIEKIANLLLSL